MMKPSEFEECAKIDGYDDFMSTALACDDLTGEDYARFMPRLFDVVPNRKEKDPVAMYEAVIEELRKSWTASENLPFHGPWHHGLVGGILIAALKNSGYDFTEAQIKEALKRGLMVPAGACGFLGTCGAAAGLGTAVSIVLRSTPFKKEERSSALISAGEAIHRVGKLGGPRCCALSTYATLTLAVISLRKLGYELPSAVMAGRCRNHGLNAQCHGSRCPYFPK